MKQSFSVSQKISGYQGSKSILYSIFHNKLFIILVINCSVNKSNSILLLKNTLLHYATNALSSQYYVLQEFEAGMWKR